MKRMAALLAGIMMTVAGSAYAYPTLDFGIISPTGGSISYAGGAAPLVGTDIGVDNVVGLETLLLNGGGFNLLGALLNFETGSLFSSNAGELAFGGGDDSYIRVRGTVDVNNNGTADTGDIIDQVLMEGTFSSASVYMLGPIYKIAGSAFTDTKNPDLLNLFGLPTTNVSGDPMMYYGNFNISFNAAGSDNGFSSTLMGSGDIFNTPVPEPGTMVLLGAGFLGLAIYGKRRKNA